MFVKFTIENFRSIKEIQELDFSVINPKNYLPDNVARLSPEGAGVVRSVGIYGANASGKSSVLMAFGALQYIACASGDLKEGAEIPCYEPYLLSAETLNKPVKFSVEFICRFRRYRYSVSFTKFEIVEEVLESFPSRNKATLFKRVEHDTWETIHFGSLFKGRNRRIPLFKNNSYLSKAGNNANATPIMRTLYSYFLMQIQKYGSFSETYGPDYEDDKLLNLASEFLCNIDTGVTAIEKKKNIAGSSEQIVPEFISSVVKDKLLARKRTDYLFSHAMEDGTIAQFRRALESYGTNKLFSMLPSIFEAFSRGSVFLIDEIDSSLHPHVAELLVKLFNDAETNVNNAQLVFSTHSLSLMSPKLMRRDQVWFVQKERGETTLFSLNEYDKSVVKSNSPFAEWYDEGRFGAVPAVNYGALSGLIRKYTEYAEKVHHIHEDANDGED
jgi:AAA15 family ATPase/GTPase